MQLSNQLPVLIVGAGLTGLACARRLLELGISAQLIEASDAPGGRVRTDKVDGFLLDRGFQVLQSAYPEAQRVLNYQKLNLHPFDHGAQIQLPSGVLKRMYDPWRNPIAALQNAFSGVGSLDDKLLIGQLRKDLASLSIESILERPDQSTQDFLTSYGFSSQMIEGFLRPWFFGVFFERDLATSARFFMFIFKMFAQGDGALPASGMGAIPSQLAEALPSGAILLNTPVQSVQEKKAILTTGQSISGSAVVVAVEGPGAAKIAGHDSQVPVPLSRSVACIYYDAPQHTLPDKALVLNGCPGGVIANLSLISSVAPSYAPPGKNLVSVSIADGLAAQDPDLESKVRQELQTCFAQDSFHWKHLRTYRIKHAVPSQPPGSFQAPGKRLLELSNGVLIAGDHRESASIQGALLSGRLAAERIARRFSA